MRDKIKLMIICLNSSKLHLTKRCINSIKDLRKVEWIEYDIWCNVNTLNNEYYKEISKIYNKDNKVKVIRTKSNGRPGKGHQSCIQLYEEQKEKYDYMAMIDGDDMYYPSALIQFSKYINDYNIDILHLLLNDYVSIGNKGRNVNKKYKNISYDFNLFSCFNEHKNFFKILKTVDIFKNPIYEGKTPSRILLVSNKIFKVNYEIKYSEEMKLYDDITPIMDLMKETILNNNKRLNIYSISDSNIYLYNSLNDESMTKKFTKEKREKEAELFREYLKKNPILTESGWRKCVEGLKYTNVSLPDNFNLVHKYKFICKNVVDFELNYLKNTNNYKKLYDYGYKSEIVLNKLLEYNLNLFKKSKNGLFFQMYINILKDRAQLYPTEFNIKTLERFNNVKKNELKSKKISIGYYTGYSDAFNGENYSKKNVWGSEIAAIKLMENIHKIDKNKYDLYIFSECNTEIKYNGVRYLNIERLSKYKLDHIIISRFSDFFLKYNCNDYKNINFILHDFRPHNLLQNRKYLQDITGSLFYNMLPNINNVIFVSKYQKEVCETKYLNKKIPEDKIKIIPNGIENNNYYKNNKPLFNGKYKNSFMYYTDPSRGLKKCCEIIVDLHKKYPKKGIKLNIYYSHILPDIKKEFVDKYNYINFHGKVSNDKINELLKDNHFFLYPNVNSDETFCISALEAMKYGNTIISIKDTGVDSTVTEKCGIFIDKQDLSNERFIEKIEKYLDKPNNELSRNSIERSKEFLWSEIAKRYINEIIN